MFAKVIIVGNVGKEPEMRYTAAGAPVTSFSVATNRQYNNSEGEKVKETTWFRVSVWNKQGEACNQYLHKGSKVLVEGRLNIDPATGGPRIWQRQDGTAGTSFEVTADTVRFLGGGEGGAESDGESQSSPDAETGEDIPF